MPQWLPHSLPIGSERVRGNRRVDCVPRVLQNRAQGPLARIITFRTPPLVHPSLPRKPSRNVRVPTDGYHFIRVHLGQRAGRPAQGRSQNTQHQTRQKRRTTDAGPRTTAPRKRSIPTTTEQLQPLGRRPHGRLFPFQGLSSQLRRAAHGRFVKARPPRPTSTRLRSRRAHESTSGGSIVAQTKRHTVPCGVPARCRTGRLEKPWHAQPNAPRPREAKIATNG